MKDSREMADFRSFIEAYIATEARPVEKFGHQPRLYGLAVEIGQGLAFDDDVLFAAAWLHDLGVFYGHRPEDPEQLAGWDNVEYAAKRAPAVLAEAGFPAPKVEAVIRAIRTHQPSADPDTMEGTILRDADILEQLGAISVLRTACKVGRDTRFPTFTQVAASLRQAVTKLPPLLRTETSRILAEPRVLALEAFLAALEREAKPALY
jgi:uncharacterized protein